MLLRPRALIVGIAVVALAGCAEPEVPVDDGGSGTVSAEPPVETPDDSSALREQLDQLQATVTAARDALVDAQDARSRSAVVREGERALAALLVDVDAASGSGGIEPLLPSATLDRSEAGAGPDLLLTTLTIAQEVGGTLGSDTTEVLRDPIAGDLGAWQRDPAGVVELARNAAASTTDLSRLERAVLELTGEATRALAWTFVVIDADDLRLGQDAAERGQAHLDIISAALDDLLADAPAADDPSS